MSRGKKPRLLLEHYLSTFADTVLGKSLAFSATFLCRWAAWALYGVGLVVAAFECGIEYRSGRGNIKDTALNAIKGFMAVGLFTTVPIGGLIESQK